MAQSNNQGADVPHASDMTKARDALRRSKKACEVCGREIGANNYARHLATHEGASDEQPRPRRKYTPNASKAAQAKGIGRYLDGLASGVMSKGTVQLGALPGFPNRTDDPEVVERAIAEITKRAADGTMVVRLKRQQRIITLRRELELLKATPNGDNPEAWFIEHAQAWAVDNGVGYSAFRAMGVPASVLTRAGITRTFEP